MLAATREEELLSIQEKIKDSAKQTTAFSKVAVGVGLVALAAFLILIVFPPSGARG